MNSQSILIVSTKVCKERWASLRRKTVNEYAVYFVRLLLGEPAFTAVKVQILQT